MKPIIQGYQKNIVKIMDKNLNYIILGIVLSFFASCDSSDSTNDVNANNLVKIVTTQTYSGNPSGNTTNVKRYVNFEVVSDSTFDYQGAFLYRTVITSVNGTKTRKTYTNTGELSLHSEENYDTQGRLVGRHTYLPPSALYFTYVYNNDGTVSSKYFNELDNQTTTFRTYTKNADGLIDHNSYTYLNLTNSQTESYEENANIQNQKLVSVTNSQQTMSFQYYPNPVPANLQKTVNQLNNQIVMGNELRYLAYNCNAYYKADDNEITTFNSDNYKTYFKSVYTNTTVTPNTTSTTEKFYFYE